MKSVSVDSFLATLRPFLEIQAEVTCSSSFNTRRTDKTAGEHAQRNQPSTLMRRPHTINWVSVQHPPWHPNSFACLNIRSHPDAWDSSPPKAANPIWAAALYFIERAYRVPRGAYSHGRNVSFWSQMFLCLFVCGFCLSLAPSNQMHTWWTGLLSSLWRTFFLLQHDLITPWIMWAKWQTASLF